jgi:steroid delta-isomerase-like uncharacterized protein
MNRWSMTLAAMALAPLLTHAEQQVEEKQHVRLWYEAFSQKNPVLLEQILDERWVDIPAPAGQPAGPNGAKALLAELSRTFPDLNLAIKDVLQDGDKVIVRAEMTGTQRAAFMGLPPSNARLSIQVIDIHQIEDGKIVRTWHSEDWLSGLMQLGFLTP